MANRLTEQPVVVPQTTATKRTVNNLVMRGTEAGSGRGYRRREGVRNPARLPGPPQGQRLNAGGSPDRRPGPARRTALLRDRCRLDSEGLRPTRGSRTGGFL